MLRSLLLLFLAGLLVLPAEAQSRRELRGTRQRGWDAQQTRRWVDYQTQRGRLRADECNGGITDRRDVILNGNRITTQILNFGSISAPGNTITDIVWNGLGYGYEFGPFVAAEVDDPGREDPQSVLVDDGQGGQKWVTRIVSDGIVSNGGEVAPDGSAFWGWQPIACASAVGLFEGLQIVEPSSALIPTSDAGDEDLDGKPDSWPDAWYNPDLEDYVWPGALQQGASNADKEAFYVMNDAANCEFAYDPFPSDPDRNCGLGLEVEVRLYQWANPLAEDAIFLVYKITNKSERDLPKVRFGMWGDPHIGGPGNWQDDLAFFDQDLEMVFAWDADGRSDVSGREPGYFGYKFLESPGLGTECIEREGGVECFEGDGIDNDGDGMIDESWTDGIDNDGDWDPDLDDVGIDGVAGTGDEGEGDGVPTAGSQYDITKPGEPNFEFTDIDESDMIGLTSFASPRFSAARVSNDDQVWNFIEPGSFADIPEEPGDYVFLYGSGSFPLRAGETKRFSIALILGESFEDLRLNADMVQRIFNVGYRFAKPPAKPTVRAVAGDEQVTLYWDDVAERSVDPLSRTEDFEGYVIYRSTDHEFSDRQTITDINGSAFLFEPLTNEVGVEAKFDLDNGISGPSDIPYPRRGVSYDLGDDTGLFHTYIDSNRVVNGQTYYYSVVAYDRGFAGGSEGIFDSGIPPSETSKTITFNPVTDTYIFDKNTVAVTPRPKAAGYVPPTERVERVSGDGTGAVRIVKVDPLAIPADRRYEIDFMREDGQVYYSVIDTQPREVVLSATPGKNNSLGVQHVVPSSFSLRRADGTALPADAYELLAEVGAVIVAEGAVPEGTPLTARFTYQPLHRSTRLALEEGNIVFDGLHLFVEDDPLAIDTLETGWIAGTADAIPFEARVAQSGPGRVRVPYDYEIRFADEPITADFSTGLPLPFEVVNLSTGGNRIDVFVPDTTPNGEWDVDEAIILLETIDGAVTATWQVRFTDIDERPRAGDVFLVATQKPFDDEDRFAIITEAARTDAARVAEEMREIYVVPNPYVAEASFEPRNTVSRTQRGDRRLYFANVPPRCTIRIYTLAGELVDTIEHESTVDDGKAFWDLRTSDNMNIAYGLYLYHVESDEGTFVGKFAVIK